MHELIDKLQVKRQFSRAATSYSQASFLQQDMSDQLIQLCAPHMPSGKLRLTDLGCGTGYSLKQLGERYRDAVFTGVDIADAMLAEAQKQYAKAEYICADMESYRPELPQDMLFANASVQWCDFSKVAQTSYQSLQPEGIFAYTSFGPQTHREIATAWRALDVEAENSHQLSFLTLEEHRDRLHAHGFKILEQQTQLVTLEFSCAQSLLDSIKKTGATNATSNRERGLLSRQRYRRFIDQLSLNQPLLLSYEIFSLVTQKQSVN